MEMRAKIRDDVLDALEQLAVELAEQGGRGAALQRTVDVVRHLTGADAAGVWEAGEADPALMLTAGSGLPVSEPVATGQGLVNECATLLEPVTANGVTAFPAQDPMGAAGFASGIAAPLVFDGAFLGVLAALHGEQTFSASSGSFR